jgi:hypothetical protein
MQIELQFFMVLVVVEAVELANCLQSRRCVSSLIKAMHDNEGELATSQEAFLMNPPPPLARLAANRREALSVQNSLSANTQRLSSRLSLSLIINPLCVMLAWRCI